MARSEQPIVEDVNKTQEVPHTGTSEVATEESVPGQVPAKGERWNRLRQDSLSAHQDNPPTATTTIIGKSYTDHALDSRGELTPNQEVNSWDPDARYLIMDRVGKGGMGEVLTIRDKKTGLLRTLKIINPTPKNSHMDREAVITSLRKEAELLGNLNTHPNLKFAYDFLVLTDHDGRTRYGIVLDYLPVEEWSNGREYLTQHTYERPTMPEIKLIMRELINALQFLRRRDIVHRDIKPGNILVNNQIMAKEAAIAHQQKPQIDPHDLESAVKLIDFGVAVGVYQETPGSTVGTAAYMSPEQALAQWELVEKEPHDVYVLAVNVFEFLTGQPLHGDPPGTPPELERSPQAIVHEIAHEDVTHRLGSADLPPAIHQVLAKALARNPAQRYPTLDKFYQAFSAAIDRPEGAPGIGHRLGQWIKQFFTIV